MTEIQMAILLALMLLCMVILGASYAVYVRGKINEEYTEPDDWPDWAVWDEDED